MQPLSRRDAMIKGLLPLLVPVQLSQTASSGRLLTVPQDDVYRVQFQFKHMELTILGQKITITAEEILAVLQSER